MRFGGGVVICFAMVGFGSVGRCIPCVEMRWDEMRKREGTKSRNRVGVSTYMTGHGSRGSSVYLGRLR